MTAKTLLRNGMSLQAAKHHLSELTTYLEERTAHLRNQAREKAEELAMAEEDLRAHEEMLEQTRRWWEEGLLTS